MIPRLVHTSYVQARRLAHAAITREAEKVSGTMRTSSALTVTMYQDGFFHVGPSPTEKKWFLTPFFFQVA
jgi:hypothetical protein